MSRHVLHSVTSGAVKQRTPRLYKASLALSYVPQSWRTAKNVVLRKAGKLFLHRPRSTPADMSASYDD